MVRNEALRLEPPRLHHIEQHRRGHRVDEACGNGDVRRPQALEVQINLGAMHADIGDDAAWGDPCC